MRLRTMGLLLRRRWRALLGKRRADRHFISEASAQRAELFSAEQLRQRGHTLAAEHSLLTERGPDRLLARLSDNEQVLRRASEQLAAAIKAGYRMTPAGDWLLDNFYLIEEQLHTARQHLPKGYSWQLPQLAKGVSRGLPRVYDIALEAISHGDGRVDSAGLAHFVETYQQSAPLSLGELWAIPIMLRLALIENLRQVVVRVSSDRADHQLAASWAERMTQTARSAPTQLILVIADMARSRPPMSSAFVAELARRLQGHGSALALPLSWLQQRLAEQGQSIEQLVLSETTQQAADQVSVSNSIGSLRLLAVTDWREFVEALSHAEQLLRRDPAGVYARMDFTSRDRYRHVLESLARRHGCTETAVAQAALTLARQAGAAQADAQLPAAHVGHYLIDAGQAQLQTLLGAPAGSRLRRSWRWPNGGFPVWSYLLVILSVTVLLTAAFVQQSIEDHTPLWLTLCMAALVAIAISQFAVAIAHWLTALLTEPSTLPRLDFSKGLPSDVRTLVAVPTMLSNAQMVEKLLDDLEIRYLANADPHLYFALLTDFPDADRSDLPGDAALLEMASDGIRRLNDSYAGPRHSGFLLLHRPRIFNAAEGVYMGHERKRGKLEALNALIRGRGDAFALKCGPLEALSGVRFVITLDTDTQLPRDSAQLLIATLAHPLNSARPHPSGPATFNAGYSILQPRVGSAIPPAGSSRYARLFGGEAGIDPYTRAVSDVYQDLFNEGSFVGKGIYEVASFETALHGRFPDNRILSHDLVEGCYARSGLVSDIEVFEQDPQDYSSEMSRRHRWIRGDWLLLGWLLPWVSAADGRRVRNPLSVLSRWKILDNLRRSLAAPALLALLLLAWTMQSRPAFWTFTVLAIGILPLLVDGLIELANKHRQAGVLEHVQSAARSMRKRLAQALFNLACLPFEALRNLDAIVRTLWRRRISGKRVLQWTPSHIVEASARKDFGGILRNLSPAPLLALLVLVWLLVTDSSALPVALPLLLLWACAPLLVYGLNAPARQPQAPMRPQDAIFLRGVARRTWAFFEQFVGPDDHWLPPDNFQQQPVAALAQRTSPTNMGMSLLANVAAHDLGYLSQRQLLQRCDSALSSMAALERFRGHFYNWYDTRSLQPLHPTYVSTVDSGNLSGHLLTLTQALLEQRTTPVVATVLLQGLQDSCALYRAAVGSSVAGLVEPDAACSATSAESAWALHAALMSVCAALPGDLPMVKADGDAAFWLERLRAQCDEALVELERWAPWCTLVSATDLASCEPLHRFLHSAAVPSLEQLQDGHVQSLVELRAELALQARPVPDWLRRVDAALLLLREPAAQRLAQIAKLAVQAEALAQADYSFLYDQDRHLFVIGYDVHSRRRDQSFYDLLASEARLGVFVAIALGQVPQPAWFALGRSLTRAEGEAVLLSWSGSMFEYLMPNLVMPSYPGTLLEATCAAAVSAQIAHGARHDVAWGVSESGYNLTDAHLNYQYRAFGVPGLGLKRGLSEDLVIAPYASVMALMVAPQAAVDNLQRLAGEGALARYGFFEAIDYTAARLRPGDARAQVQSFMAHHQGMSLLALLYQLKGAPMQRRFCADPRLKSVALLLQERIPKAHGYFASTPNLLDLRETSDTPETPVRVYHHVDSGVPAVQLLSNGRYHLMISAAGAGYSRCRELALTRWREDGTRDHYGAFCYVHELDSGAVWSTTHQPTLVPTESYQATLTEAWVEFHRRSTHLEVHTRIAVSPEDDIELRRVDIRNFSRERRCIELTSYAEVVLCPQAADASHPAFSNLFVQTEILEDRHALLCTRRPRSQGETTPHLLHRLVVGGADIEVEQISFETDRARFIGRGRSVATPLALQQPGALSGTQGSVLDPVIAIRCRITLEPEQTVRLDWVTGVAEAREGALTLLDKYQDPRMADRAFELAWTHSQVALRQLNITEAQAQLYGRLAGSIIYGDPGLRASEDLLRANRLSQSGLWGYAISGDLPIVLLQIREASKLDLVRELIQAHAYWRLRGLIVDLVIWNEEQSGYRQALQEEILGLLGARGDAAVSERGGGIYVRNVDQMSSADRTLLQAVARVVLSDSRGPLALQVKQSQRSTAAKVPPFVANRSPLASRLEAPAAAQLPADLQFDNGLGGFSADGREYLIHSGAQQRPPAPWSNVLANAVLGCVISEAGGSYTFKDNAHAFRLTPWHNDPVCDSSGEAFYLRDEESGEYWSPTPLPTAGSGAYVTRHGFGYSAFEHVQDGISSEFWMYLDPHEPVKFFVLRLRNTSERSRQLSLTGYVEWVLGDSRAKTAQHVVTELDPGTGAVFARNAYHSEFGQQVAFFDVDDATRTLTGDRREFLGRNGTLAQPVAMSRAHLSGKLGAGMDPCAAIQVSFELPAGARHQIIFRLGASASAAHASALVRRFRQPGAARAAFNAVGEYWDRALGAVQVQTPDPALNLLANGWLVYQTLACRLLARSGYYQSGGAFGFRDQLQDVMALVHTEPGLLRQQLLLCASRQFVEGDVQHWWHPPSGRGVRTACSDDLLWLPLATCRYVQSTADFAVLDEQRHYLSGRELPPGEDSYYDLPQQSEQQGSLYQHCMRAIERVQLGQHGLPLMGAGDWNDGMNRVGIHGRGESVWLGFFYYQVLQQFADLATQRGDAVYAQGCLDKAGDLRTALEAHGWDGQWYRRAYFDDGSPLGSAQNAECQIDLIAQSWSVLSGAGDPARSAQAMAAVDARLVRSDAQLIQLLDPPFDQSAQDPGYIRGYVPGVRENGGQYTHAAIWAVMAHAQAGNTARAWELFTLINPIRHGDSAEKIGRYKVEPYVVAADVYAVAPHTGRGGWTWYTGSASWMYRLIVESLLGVKRIGSRLELAPRLPDDWPGFQLSYRFGATLYRIEVQRVAADDEPGALWLDGQPQEGTGIEMVDDGRDHSVMLWISAV